MPHPAGVPRAKGCLPSTLLAGVAALALCASTSTAAAQDTLVLRDGGTRTGRLSACVGDRCSLDGAIVMRSEIAWIGLAADGPPPRTGSGGEDEVWLADGSSRRGDLVGLSLGVINLGKDAIDRSSVRWIRLAGPGLQDDIGLQPLETDVLVRRDGAVQRGELLGCGGGSCSLGGEVVAREDLAWIGVGVGEGASPPAPPADPSQDAVQLAGGALQTAPLLGIDGTTVSTGRGSFARAAVDWIHLGTVPREADGPLAAAENEPSPPPPTTTVEPPPPPPPPGQGGDTTPPTSIPPPAMPPLGEPGALWVGSVQGIYGFDDGYMSYRHTFEHRGRLREYVTVVDVDGQPSIRSVILVSEGSTHNERYESAEGTADWPTHCNGYGSTQLRDEIAGGIVAELRELDITPFLGYDLAPGQTHYRVRLYGPFGAANDYEPDCSNPRDSWKNRTSFITLTIGRHPSQVASFPDDPEIRYLEGGRMVGSYQRTHAEWYAAASWSLCRQGGDCPAAPPPQAPGTPPPSTEPCPPPTIQQSLLDVELRQQELYLDQLAGIMDRYYALSREADQWVGDYEHAARDCNLWSLAMTLAGFLVKLPGQNVAGMPPIVSGQVSPQAAGALEQFYNFLNFVDKVTSDDASWLLPDLSFQQYLGSTPNGVGGFWDAQTVYDGLRTALGFLDDEVSQQSPQSLIDGLRGCGAPTIDDVMDGAIHYLRLLQQIEPLMEQAQETLNRLEDNDEDIFNRWSDYRRACLEHVACHGGNPADCDQLPGVAPAAPPGD